MAERLGCKKVVASGARTTFLMMEERCFGYLNGEVDDPTAYLGTWKRIEVNSESIVNEISTLQSAALNPERAVKRRVQGTNAIGGDVTAELANNGYGWLITQAIGKLIGAGTSDDPYTILPVDVNGVASDATAGFQQNSDLYTADEIQYSNSDCAGFNSGNYTVDAYNLEPGFTILLSRDGGTIRNENDEDPVNHLWFKYTGCRVNTWAVTITPTEIATTTFSILGRREDIVDIAVPSYSSRPAINDPFSGYNGTITIDDETECLLSMDFTLNNNMGTDQFCLGDRYRSYMPEGQRVIEGTLTIEFTNLVYYNKFKNGTQAQVIVDFDLLGDGTETMRIIFPTIEFNGTTPNSTGNEAINEALPFIALWDENPADSILVKGATTYAPNGFDMAVEIVTAGALI